MASHPAVSSEPAAPRYELPRVLGLVDVVGILVGSVIGSGIFIVPATIAAQVQSPLLMLTVWVVGGVLSFFGALAFAELGAAFPRAGGMYVYLREAYGSFVAFLFGWTLFLVIDSGAVATLSMAFASKYLPYFVTLSPVQVKLVAIVFVAVLVAVNYVGVRYGAMLQNVLTAMKFGAILAVVGAVFFFADGQPRNLVEPGWQGGSAGLVGAFGVALVASLWAYKGWEAVSFSAGEVRDAPRVLPLGLLGGTLLIIVLYVATNLAYLWVFPTDVIARSSRVASDAMNLAIGSAGAGFIALMILFSIFGAANGNILTAPRVFYAMARDGLFFKRLSHVHAVYLTPHVSILAMGVWASVLSISGTFEQLATYVVFGQWIFFGLTVGAVVVLRRKRPDLPRPYRTWGYPITPFVFIAAALYISFNTIITQPFNALAGLLIIGSGVPAYLFWRRSAAQA
ncbi:MAG: APC family permease [Vicinamibacterales bacterium]